MTAASETTPTPTTTFDFHDKVAIVTGSAGGIGQAYAEALAAAGASVVVADIDAAKAGVNSITQQLAHELGPDNIRTNAIAPGPTDTEASRTVVPDAFMKPILAGLALKRMGQTSDLVGMCLFLLSDEASWITGHVFNLDGGQIVRP
ncbi:MAG TPA: SDR family oxidoreductase [Acidimicrobiales bacterium]